MGKGTGIRKNRTTICPYGGRTAQAEWHAIFEYISPTGKELEDRARGSTRSRLATKLEPFNPLDEETHFSKKTWEPDNSRKRCGCGRTFESNWSFFNPSGKHHCRKCGVLVCTDCVTKKTEENPRLCRCLDGVRDGCSTEA